MAWVNSLAGTSEQAIARTTPVLLAVFSLVTVLALRWCHGGPIPVPVTAWYPSTPALTTRSPSGAPLAIR